MAFKERGKAFLTWDATRDATEPSVGENTTRLHCASPWQSRGNLLVADTGFLPPLFPGATLH